MNYDKIYKLTKKNYHTEARIEIAKEFNEITGDDKFLKIFKSVKRIHSQYGYLPFQIAMFREKATGEMMNEIKGHIGIDVPGKLNSCL